MPQPIRLDDIAKAGRRIAGIATRTPLKLSLNAERYGLASLHLKMETMQPTGAFKLRGAVNAILALDQGQRARGVVAASSGNHGRAIAYAAKRLGLPAAICLSELVTTAKVRAVEAMDAEVIVVGADQDAAIEHARDIEARRGMTYIDPFDDSNVIAGQGTIGLEMLEDAPDLDVIVIQVSGGGLAGGVASAAKAINPDIRIVGVSMERGAAMHESLAAGAPVHVEELKTLADGLQGGVGLDNRYTFNLCKTYLDDFLLLSEEDIANAMREAFFLERLVLEGAGACGLGALMRFRERFSGANAAIICSGDNIDPEEFKKIVACGYAQIPDYGPTGS